jgi:hypothetical protein
MKQPWVNVRIQQITELPSDNFIPYAVTEYMLRHISFAKEHPILPGEEVTNRTVLMPLVAAPFRAALGKPSHVETLGTFFYANRLWPDIRRLYREDYYRQTLTVGIVLNSLLIVGLLVYFEKLARGWLLPLAVLLFGTGIFAISQTIFIWPKSFAGFFLVLAFHSHRRQWHPAVMGACVSVAYLCHPYAAIFALTIGCYLLAGAWRTRQFRAVIEYGAVAAAIVLPWFIWTELILHLPSDLLLHNLRVSATGQMPSFTDFVWVRLHNAFRLVTPFCLTVYPFNLRNIMHEYWGNLPCAVGVFLI